MMVLGQLLGAAVGATYVAAIMGASPGKFAWLFGLVAEAAAAWLGVRRARKVLGHPATNDQRARIALWYTLGTCAVMALLVWMAPAPAPGQADRFAGLQTLAAHRPTFAGIVALFFVFVALLRYLLLTLFNPRR
jgi:hypothetical protein